MEYPIMMRTSATDHLWHTTEENRQSLARGMRHALERLNQERGIPTFRFRDQRVKVPVKEAADLIDVQHVNGPVFRVFFAGALIMDVDLSESWRQWGRHETAFKVAVMRHYGYGIHGVLNEVQRPPSQFEGAYGVIGEDPELFGFEFANPLEHTRDNYYSSY